MSFTAKQVVEKPNLAIGLLSAFGCLFLLSLRGAYFMTFHVFFSAVGAALDVGILGRHPLRAVAHLFTNADNAIMHYIGVGIDRTAHAATELMLWMAYQILMIGVAIAAIAYELALHGWKLIERTTVVHLRPIVKRISHVTDVTVTKIAHAPAYSVARLRGEVKALETKVAHLADSITLPAPITIPRVIPKVGELGEAASWTRAQLRRLGHVLTPAGIIGLVGAALFTQFRLGWLRCSGVGRVGRALCGMSGLIEALFADALAAFAISDLCRFARGVQFAARQARPFLSELVAVEGALIRCYPDMYPHAIPLSGYVATPVIDPVAL